MKILANEFIIPLRQGWQSHASHILPLPGGEVYAVFFRNVADSVCVGLLVFLGRERKMSEQHLNTPALAFFDHLSQIDKTKADFFGGIAVFVDLIFTGHGDIDDGFAAFLDVWFQNEIGAAEVVPAGMILAQREQIFPLHIHEGIAVIVNCSRIIDQIMHRTELIEAERIAIQRLVQIAAAAGEFVFLADV